MTHTRLQCVGESCSMCHEQAEFKVAEELQFDEPARHPFTAYVCATCFARIMAFPSQAPRPRRTILDRVKSKIEFPIGPVMRSFIEAIDEDRLELEERVRKLENRA